MSLNATEKQKIVKDFQLAKNDTGSPEVQIAILSKRIAYLTEHFNSHKKDVHSKRGLLRIVNQRRKLIEYLKRKDFARYQKLLSQLGLL